MENKIVVITGGNGVLGTALTRGFAEAGAIVYILGLNQEEIDKKIKDFAEEGYTIHGYTCNVLEQDSMNSVRDKILEATGRVDVLINGAGGNRSGATIMPDQSIFDTSIDDFKKVNELNLVGTVIPSITFAKPMVDQGKGCIINISSMSAQLPLTRVGGYSASKAGVDNYTKWLAVELAQKYGEGIRVNAIAPGFFIAKQNLKLLLKDDGSLTPRGETIISQTPMKRFGKPEELVSTVLWLCDDRSSFITGIVVPIDGGFSAFSGV